MNVTCYLYVLLNVSFAEHEIHLCSESDKQLVGGWGKALGCSLGAGGPGEEVVALWPGCCVQPRQELLVIISSPALQPKLSLSPVLLGWELAVFMQ